MTIPSGSSDTQLKLRVVEDLEPVDYHEDMTIRERFVHFDETNPHVFEALVDLCFDLKSRGHDRYSIAGLFEVLRFRHAMTTEDPSGGFKLNNDFRAIYAREIMAAEPQLDGFFETRARRAA